MLLLIMLMRTPIMPNFLSHIIKNHYHIHTGHIIIQESKNISIKMLKDVMITVPVVYISTQEYTYMQQDRGKGKVYKQQDRG